jgi:hypothetical protein
MGVFHANEFIVSIPDALKDRTVNIFSLNEEGPSDVSVVVARERPKSGEGLEEYAERMVSGTLSRMPLFQLRKKEAVPVDGQPGLLLDYTWQLSEGKMYQRLVLVYARAPHMILVISVTSRDADSGRAQAMLGDFLSAFRLRA